MKKIIAGALITLAAAVSVILIIAATKPGTFSIERSIIINAGPGRIAEQIVDFRRWRSWSPYEKYDPAMQRTYRGPGSGTGAVYEWKGNSDIGSGRMEITGVSPTGISINLDFFEPMEARNVTGFLFEPQGGATRVTWSMHGPVGFIGKIFHVFVSMDGMVGRDYETGLGNLKSLAER